MVNFQFRLKNFTVCLKSQVFIISNTAVTSLFILYLISSPQLLIVINNSQLVSSLQSSFLISDIQFFQAFFWRWAKIGWTFRRVLPNMYSVTDTWTEFERFVSIWNQKQRIEAKNLQKKDKFCYSWKKCWKVGATNNGPKTYICYVYCIQCLFRNGP